MIERLEGTGDLPLRGPAISQDGASAFTTDRTRDVVAWDLDGDARAARTFTAGDGFDQWPWFAISPDGFYANLTQKVFANPPGLEPPPEVVAALEERLAPQLDAVRAIMGADFLAEMR